MKPETLMDTEKITQAVFKTEEMLAYAMFSVAVEGVPPLEGFCKISKPKTVGKLKYFSVFYIIDTPDKKSRDAATLLTSRIDWKRLVTMLPEVEDEMGIPQQGSTDYIFIEREIFMNNSECLTKGYIFSTLYPALVRLTGFSGDDLHFWDTDTKPHTSSFPEIQGNRSLLDRLKDFFPF